MRLDTRKQELQGWIVLAAALVAVLVVAAYLWDDDGLAERYQRERDALTTPPMLLATQIARQREANARLVDTLRTLKGEVGFSLEQAFQVSKAPDFARQPGFYFVTKRDSIARQLFDRAKEKGIADYDYYIGFGLQPRQSWAKEPPGDEHAIDLLKTLQITEKVVSLALETPAPLSRLIVLQHPPIPRPETVAPPGRPALLREYAITIDVRGSLKDILWLLHRLSPGRERPDAGEYPLVLKALKLTSANFSPIQNISQLDLVLTVAGMEFIPDEERAKTAGGRLGAAPPPPAESATPVLRTF